jgi:hypothetical protein
VRRLHIAFRFNAHDLSKAKKTGMFSRAVVVQPTGCFIGQNEFGRVFHSARPLRATFEVIFGETRLHQHDTCGIGVNLLAIMRGTGKRQFCVAEIQRLRGTGFHQRDGLQGLDCRARENSSLEIANTANQLATGINNRNAAAMQAFGQLAAGHVHKGRIGHQGLVSLDLNGLRFYADSACAAVKKRDRRSRASSTTASCLQKQKRMKPVGASEP